MTMRLCLTRLFHTFLIDLVSPFLIGPTGEKYHLVFVEHLNRWSLARATKYTMLNEFLQFLTA